MSDTPVPPRSAEEGNAAPIGTRPRTAAGVALGLVGAFGFACGPIFAKLLYAAGFDWAPVLAWRFILAAGVAWLPALALGRYRRELRSITRRRLAQLLAVGFLFVSSVSTYYASITFIPVSVAVLLGNLAPPLIAILSLPFGVNRLGTAGWLALIVATMGALLAVFTPAGFPRVTGVLLAVVSAAFYAAYFIVAARAAGERRGTRPSGMSTAVVTPIMFTATALGLTTLVLLSGKSMELHALTADTAVDLVAFAFLGSVVGIQASYASIARIGASRAGIFITVEPAIAVALAALVLGERIAVTQIVGAALIVAGVLVLRHDSGIEELEPQSVP